MELKPKEVSIHPKLLPTRTSGRHGKQQRDILPIHTTYLVPGVMIGHNFRRSTDLFPPMHRRAIFVGVHAVATFDTNAKDFRLFSIWRERNHSHAYSSVRNVMTNLNPLIGHFEVCRRRSTAMVRPSADNEANVPDKSSPPAPIRMKKVYAAVERICSH